MTTHQLSKGTKVIITKAIGYHLLIFLFFSLGTCIHTISAQATYTWTGNTDTNWHDVSNWTSSAPSAGIPLATDDVIIPNVAPKPFPIINTIAAFAKSITIQTSASLTVNFTLDIMGSGADGIKIDGTLNNGQDGVIKIDNTTQHGINLTTTDSKMFNSGTIEIGLLGLVDNIGIDGIRNKGEINNLTDAFIKIEETTSSGIAMLGGGSMLTNGGSIQIDEVNHQGVYSEGTLNNNLGGNIQIENTGYQGISMNSPASKINNNTDAVIQIDNTDSHAISIFFTTSTLTNDGDIEIGTLGLTDNIGVDGITSKGTIINNKNIKIEETTNRGIVIVAVSSMLTNTGSIQIDEVNEHGIYSEGTLDNNDPDALIQINNTGLDAVLLVNATSSLTNNGEIEIGIIGLVNNIGRDGIRSSGSIINNSDIQIEETTNSGIAMLAGGSMLTNSGFIQIDEVNHQGVYSEGTLNNNPGGNIQIANTGFHGIRMNLANSETNNNTDAVIQINNTELDAILLSNATSTLTNDGDIEIGNVGAADNIGREGIRSFGSIVNNKNINIKETTNNGIAMLTISSMLTNTGSIQIDEINEQGIYSEGTLDNNDPDALIQINNTGLDAVLLDNATSSLTNSGEIEIGIIGLANNIGREGIRSSGSIVNNKNIKIEETTNSGIVIFNGSIMTNSGHIQIDEVNDSGIYSQSTLNNNADGIISISNAGVFGYWNTGISSIINNNTDALIQIDHTGSHAIYIDIATSTLRNDGDIEIGALGGANNITRSGIRSVGIINNNIDGLIQIDNQDLDGVTSTGTAVFTNYGEVVISSLGGNPGGGTHQGILNSGTFDSKAGSLVQIDRVHAGIFNPSPGVMSFDGDLVIGSIAPLNLGITNNNSFTVGVNGNVMIDRTNDDGILNHKATSTFINNGEIFVGTNAAILGNGIENSVSALFENHNNITIGGTGGAIALDGINNSGSATFENKLCANIFLNDNLNNTSSTNFVNDGYIYLNTSETHVPGLFDNNGIISDLLGTFPSTAAGFTNNSILVARTFVNYCPNMDVEISPAINIGGTSPYDVFGVYMDAAGSNPAGIYDPITNTFTSNSPLALGNTYTFYIKLGAAVSGPCPDVTVEWAVVLHSGVITFVGGGVDPSDWHDPYNWDLGVVPTYCHDVVVPAPHTVKIYNNGFTGEGKTLDVQQFAELETDPNALLDIRN